MSKIHLKEIGLLQHWLHPKLFEVVAWCLTWWPGIFCITSLWRKKVDDSGIHETDPLRAIDVRSWYWSHEQCRRMERRINQAWVYDSKRPAMQVCYYHNIRNKGWHFHVQVHPRTTKRNMEEHHGT